MHRDNNIHENIDGMLMLVKQYHKALFHCEVFCCNRNTYAIMFQALHSSFVHLNESGNIDSAETISSYFVWLLSADT